MRFDLSPSREPADLINAIWEVRRADRRDLRPAVLRLLEHDEPEVRDEALSLLCARWQDKECRGRVIELLLKDPDEGVRSSAACALSLISDEESRQDDVETLRNVLFNRDEDSFVRTSSYEALHYITYGEPLMLDDDINIDFDVDLTWVRML